MFYNILCRWSSGETPSWDLVLTLCPYALHLPQPLLQLVEATRSGPDQWHGGWSDVSHFKAWSLKWSHMFLGPSLLLLWQHWRPYVPTSSGQDGGSPDTVLLLGQLPNLHQMWSKWKVSLSCMEPLRSGGLLLQQSLLCPNTQCSLIVLMAVSFWRDYLANHHNFKYDSLTQQFHF